MRLRHGAGSVALLPLLLAGAPGAAQSDPPLFVAPAILKSLERACRENHGPDEIVVCGRLEEEERSPYRVPPPPDRFDPSGHIDSVSRERNRLLEPGDTGTHSCSTSGPGGWTGCTFRAWKRSDEQWGGTPRSKRRPPR